MVAVHLQDDSVVFTVEGWHKLWSFRSELRVPRSHIKGVRRDPAATAHLAGIRAAGTYVPGLITAGTFFLDNMPDHKPTFLDVQHPDNTLVVDLEAEEFNRLIIEVADPGAVIALLGEEGS
ncbi:hypothetical protein [Hymenobacter baengnokdamensis]|uniref:hypothetical protein n=1 Tax=Hymenobacter baengnokdamensis TaxID=2615203 RepID=UPI00124655E4|nr:hypothetical protein [Hymenobacter baengnokdamensis]